MATEMEQQRIDRIEGNLADIRVGLEMMHDLFDGVISDDRDVRIDAQAKLFFVIDALREKVKQTENAFSNGAYVLG